MLKNLQVLRGIAALLVVLHHYLLANRDYGEGGVARFAHLAEFGACGVDLFFCISGFVMLGSIVKRNDLSPIFFLRDRIIRIFPAYIIATSFFIFIVAFIHFKKIGLEATMLEPIFSSQFIVSSFLLIPAMNPDSHLIQPFLAQGWTLSYELYFYLVLMTTTILFKVNYLKTGLYCSALLLCGMVLSLFGGGVSGAFLGNSILLEFIFGMIVFIISKKTKRFGALSVSIGTFLLFATIFVEVDYRAAQWGIPCAFILYGFVALEGAWRENRLLRLIGDSSYSLYLTHGVLTYLYGGLLKRGWFMSEMKQNTAVLIGIVIAAVVGFVFYRLVEKPLLQFSKKYQ